MPYPSKKYQESLSTVSVASLRDSEYKEAFEFGFPRQKSIFPPLLINSHLKTMKVQFALLSLDDHELICL